MITVLWVFLTFDHPPQFPLPSTQVYFMEVEQKDSYWIKFLLDFLASYSARPPVVLISSALLHFLSSTIPPDPRPERIRPDHSLTHDITVVWEYSVSLLFPFWWEVWASCHGIARPRDMMTSRQTSGVMNMMWRSAAMLLRELNTRCKREEEEASFSFRDDWLARCPALNFCQGKRAREG